MTGDKLENAVAGVLDGSPPADDQTGPDASDEARDAEIARLKDAYVRSRADLENARKQAAVDVTKAHKFAIEKFATDLVAVADSLEQALAADNATPDQLRSGVELTLKQLQAAFGRAQLTVIDPLGERFDPHQHQAMQMVDADQPAGSVVQVFQKGYLLNDRVLRPALVSVAKG
ncbi:MAG TPA: nucleotide exchange factor GrpE [Casimicrobiaceae bacterium]|nr:nucleotide exchange factor GrpE [Casimicrobiaceae bacterium]